MPDRFPSIVLNVNQRRAATLSAEAIRLEDSLSPQLRGYGAVDPSVAEHLDPALEQMAHALGALASMLADHSRMSSHQ